MTRRCEEEGGSGVWERPTAPAVVVLTASFSQAENSGDTSEVRQQNTIASQYASMVLYVHRNNEAY